MTIPSAEPPLRVASGAPGVAAGAAPAADPPEPDRESFAARRVMPPALVAMLAVLAGCGPRSEG